MKFANDSPQFSYVELTLFYNRVFENFHSQINNTASINRFHETEMQNSFFNNSNI
ncbi:hypothetical protein LEP1GSC035_3651 [Leptospira noguchii str. 2007001578]|uniref:Uncharacterized protein n=1 Tax=Leptospira noguchii str. 2007001578 TaxID=1049974 RepID=A0ABP2T6Y8_9LEPT|nr:hypothetical protein LEP1GSC035_3651 [Leptospira noguchii str. 2007001578]